jgi:hypothetical protein
VSGEIRSEPEELTEYLSSTNRLSVSSQNRELRRLFGPKMEEVAGEWRRVLNEELRNLYA